MTRLPDALRALEDYPQFILWKIAKRDGKKVKLPINPEGQVINAHNPAEWMNAATTLQYHAVGYGVGFVFTKDDPFFFIDIDGALEGGKWSELSQQIIGALPGAAVEVSQSMGGLHVIGAYTSIPEHASKNTALHLELYHEGRFAALTFDRIRGDIATDCTAPLATLAGYYFAPRANVAPQNWTDKPDPQWAGLEDDNELIAKAYSAQSAANIFGGKANFQNLWEADEDVLSRSYPPQDAGSLYDASSADAALAQHLAFWTGNDSVRMWRLMFQSALVRDKWQREDYLVRTINFATSLQKTFHQTGRVDNVLADEHGAPKLKASSDAQRDYAMNVRAQKLAECAGDEESIRKLCAPSGANATAKFWLDNRDKTPQELIALITPIEGALNPLGGRGPEVVSGFQYLGATLQIEHFDGCVYIADRHVIITPGGMMLNPNQFNAIYGGYVFQMDEGGDKTTTKAWDAFTMSQVVRYPKAESSCFRPELEPGALVEEEGRTLVNVYVPIKTPRLEGDPAPFLLHLTKVLPVPRDQEILLAYMAAIIQHVGIKFQWTPLLQGTEGNGKTLFTRCVAFAVGHRYTHLPPANEISEKFNAWLFEKLFIGVEEIHVPEHKKEILEIIKPMITNSHLAMRAMHQAQVMGDNRANFMCNSNQRDAIYKTQNDRRFCVFFSVQQSADDLKRDGMDGNYFPELYKWLDAGGYAIVANYLANYVIPDELNPAKNCHRAPITSTTHEAISASLGGVEQEIAEAIHEGRQGFAGGWISSLALDRLLQSLNMARAIPHVKRREILRSFGYEWHPALNQGRVNNIIAIDNGKPRLFIGAGHIALELKTPVDVVKAYTDAQKDATTQTSGAIRAFSQ